jgi:hypothetical protein
MGAGKMHGSMGVYRGLMHWSLPKIDDAKQWSDAYCPLCLSDFKTWLQEPLTQKRK